MFDLIYSMVINTSVFVPGNPLFEMELLENTIEGCYKAGVINFNLEDK